MSFRRSGIQAFGTLAALCLVAAAFAAPKPSPRPAPLPGLPAGYKPALPGYHFQFPRDHAAHPDYQTEWWYYTGHLNAGSRRFGFELTFFQVGINPALRQSRSAWALHTLYFAHFTVTDENGQTFRFTEEVSRPALGMAGSDPKRYRVWIHDWSAALAADAKTHALKASTPEMAIDLALTPSKPAAINGENGVSQKAAGVGRASHYYSLTRLETAGTLRWKGETLNVTGLSWMDHEFGSNQLTPQQTGWDWYSIQLDTRRELMLYVLRLKDGGVEAMSSGTIVNADGTTRHLKLADFQIRSTATWKSPHSAAVYPAAWEIRVPSEQLDLRITPVVPDQELAPAATGVRYWEGSCKVAARDHKRPVGGVAYVELTGYAGAAPGI